jgi:hypothetical protein
MAVNKPVGNTPDLPGRPASSQFSNRPANGAADAAASCTMGDLLRASAPA